VANEHSKQPNPGDSTSEISLSDIQSDIEALERNQALYNEKNFTSRAEAIDFIDFHVIGRIESPLPYGKLVQQFSSLKERAENLKCRLEEVDNSMFKKLRGDIKTGKCRGEAFKEMVMDYLKQNPDRQEGQTVAGYDNLDAFINGLLLEEPLPDETPHREPEMVFYQQTPARVIFELIEKADFKAEDVFYDLGSGLGHVPILANLLSGVKAKGVEFEPAYCCYAAGSAAALNLPGVQFVNMDARQADYSDGTVFFMYTPFEGKMLDEVLEKLRLESQRRKIKLFTYGPCTIEVAKESWLSCECPMERCIYKLTIFNSL